MPQLQSYIADSYSFTLEEEKAAYVLTDLQEKVIRTRLAQIISSRLSLIIDPTNPTKFIQEEAYYKGKIEVLEDLLVNSNEAKKIIS